MKCFVFPANGQIASTDNSLAWGGGGGGGGKGAFILFLLCTTPSPPLSKKGTKNLGGFNPKTPPSSIPAYASDVEPPTQCYWRLTVFDLLLFDRHCSLIHTFVNLEDRTILRAKFVRQFLVCYQLIDVSDYFPIFVIFKGQHFVRKVTRSYRNYNVCLFKEDLSKLNWEHVYRYENVNVAYVNFYDMFVNVCDKHAPAVTFSSSKKRSTPKNPWISTGIVKAIRKKHNLYTKYRSSNFNEEYGNEYKKYRNMLVTIIKNAKRMYYSDSFSENRNNMRKTWGIIKELISRNDKNKKTKIEQLVICDEGTNKAVSSDEGIANELNNYFVSIG